CPVDKDGSTLDASPTATAAAARRLGGTNLKRRSKILPRDAEVANERNLGPDRPPLNESAIREPVRRCQFRWLPTTRHAGARAGAPSTRRPPHRERRGSKAAKGHE